MNAADMATLTASIERSLRNCSLNHRSDAQGQVAAFALPPASSDSDRHRFAIPSPVISSSSSSSSSSDAATLVELNSHISLPYQWEQCLDLKTGEVYYVDWSSGRKTKEDPRLATNAATSRKAFTGESIYYCSEEEDDDDGEDLYDSEGSSTGHSSLSSLENYGVSGNADNQNDVLVVAGCKRCLMYYMVTKHVEECPKCTGQLLHFDRPDEDADADP